MGSASASLELTLAYDPPSREWLRMLTAMAAGATAAALVVFLSFHFFSKQPPLALSLHEKAGQLRISWSPATIEEARLEILDGAEKTTLLVTTPLSDVTYAVRSSDIQVRLTTSGIQPRTEVARYVVLEPRVIDLEAQFIAILAEARQLDAAFSQQDRRLTALESKARLLNGRTEPPRRPAEEPVRQVPSKEVVTRWWR